MKEKIIKKSLLKVPTAETVINTFTCNVVLRNVLYVLMRKFHF